MTIVGSLQITWTLNWDYKNKTYNNVSLQVNVTKCGVLMIINVNSIDFNGLRQ
jgi:hypothetical protein